MKKLISLAFSAALLFAAAAHADIQTITYAGLRVTAPDTPTSVMAIPTVCDPMSVMIDFNDPANPIFYHMNNCATTPTADQFYPVPLANVSGLSTALSAKLDVPAGTTSQYMRGNGTLATFPTDLSAFADGPGYVTSSSLSAYLLSSTATSTYFAIPTGTTAQYLRGDGSMATFPTVPSQTSQLTNNSGFITTSALSGYLQTSTATSTYFPIPTGTSVQYLDGTGAPHNFSTPTRTFNYPSRALSSCFQVSSTQDADVNYSVDINASLSLGGGTGVLTTYTNSGCSTGAQIVFNGAVSSVSIGGTSSIPLHAIVPAGKWAKVTGTASGGGTATIEAVQAETLLP